MCIEEVGACVKASKEGCVCNSLMQYSRLCVFKGVVLKWRTDEFCRKLFLSICDVDLVNFHLHIVIHTILDSVLKLMNFVALLGAI